MKRINVFINVETFTSRKRFKSINGNCFSSVTHNSVLKLCGLPISTVSYDTKNSRRITRMVVSAFGSLLLYQSEQNNEKTSLIQRVGM